jgi:hypothetical protein
MAITWNGEPLLYQRTPRGYGLIIGAKHYRLRSDGNLETLDELNEFILRSALARIHGERAGVLFAVHAKTGLQQVLKQHGKGPPK